MVFGLIVGCFASPFLTGHIAGAMWGDSPYSEASAIWSIDNSGNARFADYMPFMVRLALGFSFGLVASPGAAVVSRRNHSTAVKTFALVWTCLFGVGLLLVALHFRSFLRLSTNSFRRWTE